MTDSAERTIAFAAFELVSRGAFDEFEEAQHFARGLARIDYTEGLAHSFGEGLQELARHGQERLGDLLAKLRPLLCSDGQPRVAAEIATGGLSYLTGLLSEKLDLSAHEVSALAHVCLSVGLNEICSK
jgi:hypothetical protein